MSRTLLLSASSVLLLLSSAVAESPVKESPKPTGILVLDDCDSKYRGKDEYHDNLTLLDAAGKQAFRITGFNNCQSIGSKHMIATDSARRCIWVVENAGNRIRRFDLGGKETLAINEAKASAIAVDPETGYAWVLTTEGKIYGKATVVYDGDGKVVATHGFSGYDIVYDRKAKAFWIAAKKLTKVIAATGKIEFSKDIAVWCASSVDVDPTTGAAWVAVRQHEEVAGSKNRLLKIAADGQELAAVELGPKDPFRVSVDPNNGSVWMVNLRTSVEQFSADGKLEGIHLNHALSVQVDHADGNVWVVTDTEVLKMTPAGKVTKQIGHAGPTSQAWIAAWD